MLIFRISRNKFSSTRGFTLIELMVAIVIGMITIAGAVKLIVAINQANSETIESTRLTQELRTLASVISSDLKRMRRVDDPIAIIGQGVATACPDLATPPTTPKTPAQPCYRVTVTSGIPNCISYGYTGTTGNASLYNYHSIRRTVTSGVGAVILDQLTFNPSTLGTSLPLTATVTACPVTGSTATKLSSDNIDITSLCFSTTTSAGACQYNAATANCEYSATPPSTGEADMCIVGKLVSNDPYTKAIQRAFVQPVFIRSSSIN